MEISKEKLVQCLKSCATGSFSVCEKCPYRRRCTDLITDAIALLEAGRDFSKEKEK